MRWDGPYIIDDKLSELNNSIRKPTSDTTQVVHIKRLKLWKEKEKDVPQTDNSTLMPLAESTETAI